VFYEDRDQINFVSLAYLAKQEPVVTYKYKTKNTAEDTEGLAHKPRDVKQDLYNVDNIQNQTGFDTIKAALSGETTASLFSVDPIRRSYSLKAFDLRGETSKKLHNMDLLPNSSWDSFHHMEKGKPWKENGKTFVNPKANMAMLISDNGQDTHEYISSRDKTITPYAPEEFFLQRKSNRQQILKNVITTTVSGDPRIKVGCVIKFEVPELMGKIGKLLDHGVLKKDIVRFVLKDKVWDKETIEKAVGVVMEYNKNKERKKADSQNSKIVTSAFDYDTKPNYETRSTPELLNRLVYLLDLKDFTKTSPQSNGKEAPSKAGVSEEINKIKKALEDRDFDKEDMKKLGLGK
jgi:pullulanase/glycogen debranching enzyme